MNSEAPAPTGRRGSATQPAKRSSSCSTGQVDLVQWIDGAEHVVPLVAGQAVVNPVGVWHTAGVHEPGRAPFITPGRGTENVALADFLPA